MGLGVAPGSCCLRQQSEGCGGCQDNGNFDRRNFWDILRPDTHACPRSRWAQSSQKRSWRGCLIGTLKIKSQLLIAALGSGACNSSMLGSDFPPLACCIGDTNICGASWVCAVNAALLLYASEWSRAKPGLKTRGRISARSHFKQWEDLNHGLGLAPGNVNPLPTYFPQLSCLQLILSPPPALACSWEEGRELRCGRPSGFVLRHGTTGQRGLKMGGRGWRTGCLA